MSCNISSEKNIFVEPARGGTPLRPLFLFLFFDFLIFLMLPWLFALTFTWSQGLHREPSGEPRSLKISSD